MKMKAVVRYSAKPMGIALGILLFCTAILRLMSAGNVTEPIDMLFFFLMGAFTFPRRTDILMQYGVSREKQYAVLWGLCLFAVLTGILDAVLQSLGASLFHPELYSAPINAVAYFRTWYNGLESVLLYAVISALRNTAALFAGHLAGILAYRFLRAGSRLNVILPCILSVGAVSLKSTNRFAFAFNGFENPVQVTEIIPEQFMDSPLRWVVYFWVQNFFGLPYAGGDSVLFAVSVPLFYVVILASLCCILLRSLPIRRGLDA